MQNTNIPITKELLLRRGDSFNYMLKVSFDKNVNPSIILYIKTDVDQFDEQYILKASTESLEILPTSEKILSNFKTIEYSIDIEKKRTQTLPLGTFPIKMKVEHGNISKTIVEGFIEIK